MSEPADFLVIPALDLKGGAVVQARGGHRAAYRSIETPFGAADDAIAISRALLAVTQSPILYIADLDAIEGVGNHFELTRDLGHALPDTDLWIDAGFTNVTDCLFWLPLGATLVVGSESLPAVENWDELRSAFGETLVLSLDYAGAGPRGPGGLFAAPATWPARVVVMNLDRVGSGEGPDIDRLRGAIGEGGGRSVYAAGGVRGIGDLEALAETGAAGTLLADALHRGAVTQTEIAAFLQRRRSR
jgi:phosphoribosylformimino-5-aminoimidazole carboxamide ribotide isomerase